MPRQAVAHPLRPVRAALLGAALVAGLLPAPVAAATVAGRLTDGAGAPGAPTSSTVRLSKVADVTDPVLAIGARDGSGRLFIVAKEGRIRIVKGGDLLPAPFLDLSRSVSTGGEQGLLGLAFHPSFATNRRFYVNYTDAAGDTVVREYRASSSNPDVV